MPKQPSTPVATVEKRGSRVESILAFSALAVIAVSIISMFVTLVLMANTGSNMPAILAQIPLFGVPLGAVLIITLVVLGVARRRRENRG